MKKYFIIYKTTCVLTGKIYIGVHSQTKTPFEFDGYLGSGMLLKNAIKKYGKENFVRQTLFVFDNYEKALQKEKEIVNEEFILRDDTYNICLGGTGGDTTKYLSEEQKQKIRENIKQSLSQFDYSKLYTEKHRKLLSQKAKERIEKFPYTIPNNKGRIYDENALNNLKESGKKRKGKYIWITNNTITVHHLSSEPIPEGWRRGRGKDFQKKNFHTDETKQKIANNKNIKGVICYTNGIINIKLQPSDEIPEGFYRGMTQKKKNTVWITNGVENKMHKITEPIPEGWYKGRTIVKKGEKYD